MLLKITDLIADPASMNSVELVQEYIRAHPTTRVLGNPDSLMTIVNRYSTLLAINALHIPIPEPLEFPKSDCITSLEILDTLESFSFPLICKTVLSCGKPSSHRMGVVTSAAALRELIETESVEEWVLQEFINHSGYIYKVYVLGDHSEVHTRASIPDIPADFHSNSPTLFHSHDPIDPFMFGGSANSGEPAVLSDDLIASVSSSIRQGLGLELFGFDLISDKSGKLYIVDVNYFPSFKQTQNVKDKLLKFMLGLVDQLPAI